jgi:Tol biopolymer transport system component
MSRQQRRALDRAAAKRGGVRTSPAAPWRAIIGAVLAIAVAGWFIWRGIGDQPPTREGAPSWARDGRIVYYAEQAGSRADLFVMHPETGTSTTLLSTPTADEGSPAFSPDGRFVAFDSDQAGNFDVHVMRADASSPPQNLTKHPARDLAPAWSPDGRQIVFMSDRDARPEFDIYRMEADGSGVERLTTSGTNWFPQYSPDGSRIALHVGRDVHILDLKTRQLRRLTSDPLNGMYPTWSPDASRLAFMSWRNGRTEIFTMNDDGSDQQLLVSMPRGSAIDPRWSPDGGHIVFVHVPEETVHDTQAPDQTRMIYTVEIASGRMRRLSR